MPPKRKAPAKKKLEAPPPSESEAEQVSSEVEPPAAKRTRAAPKTKVETPKAKVETPKAKAETPKAKAETPKAKAETPKAKAQTKQKAAPVTAVASPKKAKTSLKGRKAQPTKKVNKLEANKVPPVDDIVEKKTDPKHVVIEHSKQCSSFKRTATKLEELLKKAVPGLEVSINPDKKPRNGVFEVRDGNGTIFFSLTGLSRPFKPMKDLNLEETASDVASKLT